MTAKAAPKRLVDLDDEEVSELLGLLRGADSVELKLTVPDVDHRSTIHALDLDPLDAQIRQVFFFDTPDLALNAAGVVARARRVQGKEHDSVVKLRPVTPDSLPESLRAAEGVNVEVDAMPGGYVCSASYKRALKADRVAAAVRGDLPVRKLFSKQQRAFFDEHAPEGVELDDLSVLGPIFVLKLKRYPAGIDRKLVAEAWLYPDGKRILELSTKCPPMEIFNVAMESRAFLSGEGVNLSGEQQTKTKTALEFFASQLQGKV
jgi:hypothetical protein